MNQDLLRNRYKRADFIDFADSFLPDFYHDLSSLKLNSSSLFKSAYVIGKALNDEISIIEINTEASNLGKRISTTKEAFKILRDHAISNALIVFDEGHDQWRLSLLTTSLRLNEKGRVVTESSNQRRYSYLLGVDAKTVTPYKHLIEKGPVEDIKQLQDRFSVEVVNKQFYASIADLFTKLVGGKRGSTNYPGLLEINSVISQNIEHQEFAVRLIGRIIFSWFLKEKKSTAGVPIVPNELLSLAAVTSNADYYHSILEPLFFEILNKRIENRHASLRKPPFSTVPYLNGGLFSPDQGDYYNQNTFNGAGTPGLTHIPDSWFTELFTVLEQYNFTVDENTSYDVDLSIDPEMLGRIFENLLAEINPETGESARKSTGSFYTPREIVEYMVDSSLIEFLNNKTNITEDKLKILISWGQADDEENPLSSYEKEKVVSALSNLTILDPASGSGAFPIGILQKVVYILQQVDENAELWLQNQLSIIKSPEFRRDIEEKYRNGNYDYLRKLGVIRESIFGIDIQSIATEISKLRCFLTLIIDEDVIDDEPNRGVRALPNLDFKFVTANSLIGLPENDIKGQSSLLEDTAHIDSLKSIREEYFTAPNDTRSELKNNFYRLQKQMFDATINKFGGTVSSRYSLLSSWDPFEHRATDWFDSEWMFGVRDKFDIVIGNPPYGASTTKEEKDYYRKNYYSATTDRIGKGSLNTYSIFIDLAYSKLLKKTGVLAYIVPMSITSSSSLIKLHKLMLENSKLITISNYSDRPRKVFDTAEIAVSILFAKLGSGTHRVMSTKINKRYTKENSIADVIAGLKYVDVTEYIYEGRIPKFGIEMEKDILKKLKSHTRSIFDYFDSEGKPFYYRSAGGRYYKIITNFATNSRTESSILLNEKYRDVLCALFTSNLYYWYYHTHSDNLSIKKTDLLNFPIPNLEILDETTINRISEAYKHYIIDLKNNSEVQNNKRKGRNIEVVVYYARKSKKYIDLIDKLICPIYGLNEHETEFIINYEKKYRVDDKE